ncbi:hypothetical protein [Kribbella sp. NPDC049227]|uniref:hypothetical protein n=1 Tax=Kribbella sp. NPDC049227 TaxID=3364113 RepID=UPI003714C595
MPATTGYLGSRRALSGVIVLTLVLIVAAIAGTPLLLLTFAVLVVAVRSQKLDASGQNHSLQLVAEMTRLASVLVPHRRRPTAARTRSATSAQGRPGGVLVTGAEVTPIPLRGGVDP